MLDIIIPHYTEDWQVGKKMFSMLDLQRGVDFALIRVIVVNDGEENALDQSCYEGHPYRVDQISIPHAGVSAARNAGLRASQAPWVMFCDFDDMFAHVYALRDILNALKEADGYDMLWSDLYIENGKSEKWELIKKTKEDAVFTHGKLFRRQCLLDNDLWFNTELAFNEDSEFNAIFHTKVDFRRTGKLITDAPPYVWCWRKDSTTNRNGANVAAAWGHYKRNVSVCKAFAERMPLERYCAMVTRMVYDTYYTLNGKNLQPELEPMKRDFRLWYAQHKQYFGMVSKEAIGIIDAVSRSECIRQDHDQSKPINLWLAELEAAK